MAILDNCIIKITTAKGKRVLYQHPKYNRPSITVREIEPREKVGHIDLRTKGYTHTVCFDGQMTANFKSLAAANTIYGEGFTLVEAETPEEANEKNDTILQTVDPRIEWDDNVADYQQLDDDSYEYEDFSFDTKDGPTLVDPEDYDEETLARHRKAWADSTPNGAGLKHPC